MAIPRLQEIGILVVDALDASRLELKGLLEADGYERVYLAGSGPEALRGLSDHADIGLVLLESTLPDLDGYEICRRIQANADWREIPVIMITGEARIQRHTIMRSFEVGATDYVTRPIDEVELFARIGMALTLYQERLLRRRESERLQESEERFRLTFDLAPIGIAHVDLSGRIVQTNQSLASLLGYGCGELVGMPLTALCAPEGVRLDLTDVRSWLAATGESLEIESAATTRSGEQVWVNLRISLLYTADHRPVNFVMTFEDVTERKHAHQEMERIAFHDPVTALPNRRLFNRQLSHAVVDAEAEQRQLAVFFIDLDHFKQVNDSLGHAAGDLLLLRAGERIAGTLGDRGVLARLGGDEFGILMHRRVSAEAVAAVAQAVVDSFAQPLEVENREIFVTPSIGISLYPQDGVTPEALMKNADAAMYRAKEIGRNQFRLYTAAMSWRVEQRLSLEQALRRAQEREELRVYYQPLYDLKRGTLVAAEALVRWEHSELGLLPPEQFIPLAEDTGLILAIGEWVLRSACDQILAWQARGLPLVPVMVNLSLIQTRTDDLIAMVVDMMERTGLRPGALGIEVTENTACLNMEQVIGLLRRLRGLGVKIIMDDFGSGYSSLNRLKRFPVDSVKIDKAFISGIPDDHDDVAILRAIIALAKTLNLEVVAEGVENERQAELLRRFDCDAAQGFYFARPMPAAAFESLFGDPRGLADASGPPPLGAWCRPEPRHR